MKPTEEIAVRLVGGAQSAYVQELSYFFLNLLDEVAHTNGAVIRGREIADFERLSRLSREEALAIYYKYRPAIDKQTREVLKEALKKTDDALVGQFVRAMGSRRHMTNLATIIAAQTAQGMNEVLERQNIALAKDQAALWYDVTAEAIARHQAGEPTRAVMERGVTRLANSGLETIDYISGTKTTIDAALRRHIVSQANQARNRLLMQRMDEWEWDLVFVDAHFGARPSHAEWQGKVYSRSGRSTEYPSLVDATGYGTVTGLCGANCYHYMTPYVPGYSQLPDMDYSEQERITGMTSDEYYAVTQKQRRYERLIRSQKREISYLQEVRADAVKQRIRLGELQDKLRQFTHDNHLRRDYERERAWAVSKQPRALRTVPASSGQRKDKGPKFQAIQKAITAKNPIFFPSRGAANNILKAGVTRIRKNFGDERYIIGAHGSPRSIQLYDIKGIKPKILSNILANRNDYNGEPIQLMCCSTGKVVSGTCFAQELADLVGVDVYAPPSDLYINAVGKYFISTKSGKLYGTECMVRFSPRLEG